MWRPSALFVLCAVSAACGNHATSAVTADAGDASIESDAGAIFDAAPPPDADQHAYPAHHHSLPLLDTMKIVTVTFEGDELRQFDDAVVTSAWWTPLGNGFRLGPGSSGGYAELKDTVSGKTLDNEIHVKTFIQDRISDHTLPDPDTRTLYAIYFPTSTTIQLGTQTTCPSLRGFHDSVEVRLDSINPIQVAYAVLPRCAVGTAHDDTDSLTLATSHEILEAATDPQPDTGLGWIMGGNDAWTGVQGAPMNVGTWAVTTAWSNVAAKASRAPCQPSATGRIYFNATVASGLGTVHTSNGDHVSDGFVTVTRGQSRDVDVVVFSEAALPSDVTLTVGRVSLSDPTKLTPMATGITATLSRTKAHNGETSTLTLSAMSSAIAGDSLFLGRASLPTNEYHSWPVILRRVKRRDVLRNNALRGNARHALGRSLDMQPPNLCFRRRESTRSPRLSSARSYKVRGRVLYFAPSVPSTRPRVL